MSYVRLKIYGVSLAERLSLAESLGAAQIESSQQRPAGTRHGTLDLFDVLVALTPQVVALLGIWLAKNRERRHAEEDVEVFHPDGRIERRTLRYRSDSSSTDAEVAKQIAEIAGINRPTRSPAGRTNAPAPTRGGSAARAGKRGKGGK